MRGLEDQGRKEEGAGGEEGRNGEGRPRSSLWRPSPRRHGVKRPSGQSGRSYYPQLHYRRSWVSVFLQSYG